MAVMQSFGAQSMYLPLRRVLVRAPSEGACREWARFAWRAEPDPLLARDQHEHFTALLAEGDVEVLHAATNVGEGLDSIYTFDPALVTDQGAVILRAGKEVRRSEADLIAGDLMSAGVPVFATVGAPATVEGGDAFWLDERTLVVGRSYRTNEEGIRYLASTLKDIDIVPFDLPHVHGPAHILHMMSLISILDRNLALVYLPLLPVRLVELLRQRGFQLLEVPDEEFATHGTNVLALAPRVAVALEGNNATRHLMEDAEVDVRVYPGSEISMKGDGGPTCLTRPILRRE